MPKDVLQTNTVFILASPEDQSSSSSSVFLQLFKPIKCSTLDFAPFTSVGTKFAPNLAFGRMKMWFLVASAGKACWMGYHVSHKVANDP